MQSKVGMGGEQHRYYKHTKQRGDPKFLVDLTWNDPYIAKAKYLDKFEQQWSKKTLEIQNGRKMHQVPKVHVNNR